MASSRGGSLPSGYRKFTRLDELRGSDRRGGAQSMSLKLVQPASEPASAAAKTIVRNSMSAPSHEICEAESPQCAASAQSRQAESRATHRPVSCRDTGRPPGLAVDGALESFGQ